MREPAISVRDVVKTYGEGAAAVHALRSVSLEVRRGEVVLLMGPSGSGKTTLLSVMGCILRPTSGSVRIAGREAAAMAESALPAVRLQHIGFIFQGFNLFPTLTAGENVELALDLKGVRGADAQRRAEMLLAQVGLADKVHSFPSDLSGGQKQRVAIARWPAIPTLFWPTSRPPPSTGTAAKTCWVCCAPWPASSNAPW